ncbi:MAG: phosphoenolpyruvate synthase [Hyphomonadaceae bacterium]|nr:phosphoenolpyruvate synthase [Hyphomonadaceae bacterium]
METAQYQSFTIPLERVGRGDVAIVGGKNASLGEMIQNLTAAGLRVPGGFASTAGAFRLFIADNGLAPVIEDALKDYESGAAPLEAVGARIRAAFLSAALPASVQSALKSAYETLCGEGGNAAPVAVRSSATAEDLPEASFAGQHETYLNITGAEALLDACKRCFASAFTDRAIAYREAVNFDHMKIALSVGVQRMVRADVGGAGVLFSLDTETGFPHVALINAAWGLGESIVQGSVDPDEYQVFKPLLEKPGCAPIVEKKLGAKQNKLIFGADGQATQDVTTSAEERARFVLSDEEILRLGRWAVAIERHYGRPMDIEWAKDGVDGRLYVLQARPETVQSRAGTGRIRTYAIKKKGVRLAKGLAIGGAAAIGPVCVIKTPDEIGRFVDGAVLVAQTTDPDWVPMMKRAAAIVTDHGGRTSHAAIVAREVGVPAIVGAGDATSVLRDGQDITVSCAEGDQGFVYEGRAEIAVEDADLSTVPATRTKIMLNLADPGAAFRWWRLPADGVGLARMEFVISHLVKAHPMALIHADKVSAEERATIDALSEGYPNGAEYFVDKVARGLSRIAAVFHPKLVIIRMSDFKTNEYAKLVGGGPFEPQEENPMIGFRGASRYYSLRYREGFALECRAIRRLRNDLGFANVVVMIPFCRSIAEADRVLAVMAENGLERGRDGLQVYVMCEIPSNVVLARAFAERFDGFSIGSNDLTQLTLGVDRDCEDLAGLFDEQDDAVRWMIERLITEARAVGAHTGLCGQAPSDHPEFAAFLVGCGIDSISVTPDSFLAVKRAVAKAEASAAGAAA